MSIQTLLLVCLLAVAISQHSTTAKPKDPPIVCNRPNEIYACGGACQTECRTLGETCPIVNIRCNDACYCVDGYARDSNGKCIPQSQCPKKPASSSYEV